MHTPPLPGWIREASVPGYENAHQLCPGEPRLYGTESLFGDWGGKVLLLAKDFGPSSIVRGRIAAGDPRPYRHEPRMRANRRLVQMAEPIQHLGLLYGSALANLLRADGRVSGTLPNRTAAMAHGVAVLRWVLGQMPALRRVVCLGAEAWECGCAAIGLVGDWREHRESGEPLGPLVAAYHPSARVSPSSGMQVQITDGCSRCVDIASDRRTSDPD
jgi:hypothetical protein